MAEMTAEQALSTLASLHRVGPYDLSDVIEVIEQQAQEIERLNGQIEFWTTSHEAICKNRGYLGEEIAKRGRMLERLIDKLIEDIAECPSGENCSVNFEGKSDNESNEICRACWLAWLEKEAEEVE